MIQQTVRSFVERELMPLENEVLQSEGKYPTGVEPRPVHSLQAKAKAIGFWGINTPKKYGGANLGAVMSALIAMEMGRTLVPFSFGGNADKILSWQRTAERRVSYSRPSRAHAIRVSPSPNQVRALTPRRFALPLSKMAAIG